VLSNARTTVLLVIAKENKLDINFVETNPDYELSGKYLELNPLKRIPTFEAADGWVLSEVIAIAIYCKYPRDNPHRGSFQERLVVIFLARDRTSH
jgi:glutathione S-transferase